MIDYLGRSNSRKFAKSKVEDEKHLVRTRLKIFISYIIWTSSPNIQ